MTWNQFKRFVDLELLKQQRDGTQEIMYIDFVPSLNSKPDVKVDEEGLLYIE